MKTFDVILDSHKAQEIAKDHNYKGTNLDMCVYGATAYAQGLDFSGCELNECNIKYKTYIDTVNSIDIYYDYGADYYFFAPSDNE